MLTIKLFWTSYLACTRKIQLLFQKTLNVAGIKMVSWKKCFQLEIQRSEKSDSLQDSTGLGQWVLHLLFSHKATTVALIGYQECSPHCVNGRNGEGWGSCHRDIISIVKYLNVYYRILIFKFVNSRTIAKCQITCFVYTGKVENILIWNPKKLLLVKVDKLS